MGRQLAAIPPPSAGLRASFLRPILSGLMRLQRAFDRMLRPTETEREESAFRALEPDSGHGPILSPADAPLLFKLLDHLDKKMGGVRPTEVRVGLLPACGVLDLNGASGGNSLRQVLIIGLPCFQIWTVDELSAVVAHEMAHLKLRDAVFTRDVVQMSGRLRTRRGWGRFLGCWIGRAAAGVCRAMEFRADEWSALCFRSETLASALEKLLVVQPIFRLVLDRFDDEQSSEDTAFDHFARSWSNLGEEKYVDLRRKFIASLTSDPLDPHPSLVERLNRLARTRGVAPPPASASAMRLFQEPEQLKRMLSNRFFRPRAAGASVFVPADAEH